MPPTWLIEVIDGQQVLDSGVGDRIPAVSREMHARPLVGFQLNSGNVHMNMYEYTKRQAERTYKL